MKINSVKNNSKEYRTKVMRCLIYTQILFLLLFAGIFRAVPLLSSVRYLTDIVTMLLFIGVLCEWKTLIHSKGIYVVIPMLIYIAVCVFSVIVNGGKFTLILWAARNIYRFFVFYCACICYLKIDDLLRFINFLERLQYINFFLVIIEFVYFTVWPEQKTGIKQDLIGGIFGIQTGCNGVLNIFLCMVFTIVIIKILKNGTLKTKWLYLCTSILLCAAFAELKVFYLEACFIYIACALILYNKETLKLSIELLMLLLLIGGASMLLMHNLYPYTKGVYLHYQDYENANLNGAYRIGRLSAFQQINELFFDDSIKYKLLGLGFGNCEYSQQALFISDFYRLYGEYNYRWFMHQMLYLETGILGVISFVSIMATAGIQSLIYIIKRKEYKDLALFAGIMAGIFLINIFYNNEIRTDSAYIDYLCLGIVPILIYHQRKGGTNVE